MPTNRLQDKQAVCADARWLSVSAGWILLALCLMAITAATPVSADAPADEPALIALFELSGMDRAVEQMGTTVPDAIRQSLDAQVSLNALSAARAAVLADDASAVFTAAYFRTHLLDSMREQLSDTDVRTLMAFYQSPLGERTREAERRYGTDDGMQGLAEFSARFKADPDHAQRLTIVKEINNAYQLGERIAQITVETQVAMVLGIWDSLEDVPRQSRDEMIDQVRSQQEALVGAFNEMMTLFLAYTFQGFSVDDLHRLEKQSRTAVSQRFNKASMEGLRSSMVLGGLEFGERAGNRLVHSDAYGDI